MTMTPTNEKSQTTNNYEVTTYNEHIEQTQRTNTIRYERTNKQTNERTNERGGRGGGRGGCGTSGLHGGWRKKNRKKWYVLDVSDVSRIFEHFRAFSIVFERFWTFLAYYN